MRKLVLIAAVLFTLILPASCYNPLTPSLPSFSFKIAWPWDSTIIYAKGDRVTMAEFIKGGPIYKSLQDGNVRIWPPTMIAGSNPPQIVSWMTSSTQGWEIWWTLMPERQE